MINKIGKKQALFFEFITWIISLACFIFILRPMLISGLTTLSHDNILWYYPAFKFFADNIIHGDYVFWNPFSHAGETFYPFILSFNMLNPVLFITVYIGKFIADDITLLFNWHNFIINIIMVFGVYLVLRRWAKHFLIRHTLIPILLYSSFTLVHFRMSSLLEFFVWTPYIALILIRIIYYKDQRWLNWILLGILIGINWSSYLFVGVWMFITFFFLGLLFFQRGLLIDLLKSMRIFPKIAVMSVIILAMTAPNIAFMVEKNKFVFPARMVNTIILEGKPKFGPQQHEGMPEDIVRGINMPYEIISKTGTFSTIWDFIQIIAPDGNWRLSWKNRKSWGYPTEAFMYLGVLPWFISLLGIVAGRHGLKKIWLLIMAGFGLLMLGPPGGVHRLLYYVYPPLWFIRHTHLFVLFFIFALLYFYVLGFNYIVEMWDKKRVFTENTAKDVIKYPEIGFFAFTACMFFSVYCMTQLQYPDTDYLFLYIILIVLVGIIFRKNLGKKRVYTSFILSHTAIVLYFSANTLKFCIYMLFAFAIPFFLFLFFKTYKYRSEKSKRYAAVVISLIFVICLVGDLLYSFIKSESLYTDQINPGYAMPVDTTAQKPMPPFYRAISPKPYYATTGQSLRYLSLLYRQAYVFSPVMANLNKISPISFEFALKSKRWNSFLLFKNYFSLIHSGIPVAAMEEMFSVNSSLFQYKKGAVLLSDKKAYKLLKELGSDDSSRLLKDYVIINKNSQLPESGFEASSENYESIKRISFNESKPISEILKNKQIPYKKKEDGLAVEILDVSLDKIDNPAWMIIDFGENNKKVLNYLKSKPREVQLRQFFSRAVFIGSNDGKMWEKIGSVMQDDRPDDDEWISYTFPNEKAFRFYKINFTGGQGNFSTMAGLKLGNFSKNLDIDLGETNKFPINLIRMEINEAAQFLKYVIIQGSFDSASWHKIATFRRGVDFNNMNDEPISLFLKSSNNYRYYRFIINGLEDNEKNIIENLKIYGGMFARQSSYNSFDINISSDKDGFLYWADGYDNWWRAYVNEIKVPIYRANINFKAIPIQKGESRIRFEYDPILFKTALLIFYITFVFSLLAVSFLAIYTCSFKKFRPMRIKSHP